MYCESQSLQGTVTPRRARPPSLPGTFLFALCTKPLSECPRFLSCLSQQSWQADTCSSSCWGAGSLPPARREPQTPLPVPSLTSPTLDPEGRDREALNVGRRSTVGPGAHQTTPSAPRPPHAHTFPSRDWILCSDFIRPIPCLYPSPLPILGSPHPDRGRGAGRGKRSGRTDMGPVGRRPRFRCWPGFCTLRSLRKAVPPPGLSVATG